MTRELPPTLRFTAADDRLRTELRQWLAANAPHSIPTDYHERIAALRDWQRRLAEAGFIGMSWPVRYGGRGLGLSAEAVLADELAGSDHAELINRLAVYTWGPAIMDFGTEEQRRRFLPGMRDAGELWCQGFSEPGAGSDLAAVRTRACRDGDELVISGQKVWTSRAELSRWNALLVRTRESDRPTRGLTVVLVDMRSAGITIRPLLQMLGEPHFSEVFFDEVRVPVDHVLGELDRGWSVAMAAMSYERGIFVLERQIRLRRRLDDLLCGVCASQTPGEPGEAAMERIGRAHAELELLKAQAYRTLAAQQDGRLRPGETSVDKLYLARVYQGLFSAAFDLTGQTTPVDDGWAHDLLESRSVSIYSGTSEIQRNVIARQLLGVDDRG